MDINLVHHIDFEISSICNAGCSVCSRRPFGRYGKFTQTYWSIEDVVDIIDIEIISNLTTLTLCGNFGDPLGNPDIVKIVKYFLEFNPKLKININTNGGIGEPKDFEELGKLGVQIMFGLDGIGEKNELYRVNVNWGRVVENITSFVKYASDENVYVQFLMWAETTDQIIPMVDFIQSLGKGILFLRKPASNGDKTPVFNMKSEITHYLSVIKDEEYIKFFDTMWEFDRLDFLKEKLPIREVKELELGNYKKMKGIIEDFKEYQKTEIVLSEDETKQLSSIIKQTCYSKNNLNPSDLKGENYNIFITYNKLLMPCCLIPPNISISMFNSNGLENSYQKETLNRMLDLGFENFSLRGKKLKQVLETNILDKFVYDDLSSDNPLKICKVNCGKC